MGSSSWRRLIARLAVPGLLLLGLTAIASAAPKEPAQIDGDYEMTGRIYASNDGTRGEVRSRSFRFTPLCSHASCRKVELTRDGPGGQVYRSILRRTKGGRFRGTERAGGISCPGPELGRQSADFVFWITRSEAGLATALRGKAYFRTKCPGEDPFQRARLYLERK